MTHAPLASRRPAIRPVAAAALRLVTHADEERSYAALVDDGQLAERQGRREEARRLYELALTHLSDAPSGKDAAAILRWIARTHQVDANPELALDCLEASLAVAESYGDLGAIGHATNLQAIVLWQQGELDQAERLLFRARESAIRSGEAKLAAMTAQNLGVIANIRGDLDTALRHYETALADYRALGLASDVCVALNNLGMLHTDRAQWTEATRAYEEALEIAAVLGDVSTRIMIEVNFAGCWVAQGELDRARVVCDRAMQLSRDADDHRAHGELYKIYGIIARESGDVTLAEQCLARAEDIAERRQDLLLLAECAMETADVRRRQNRNRDTLQSLNRAHRLFAQLRARRELADVGRRVGQLESEFLDVVRRWGESIESKDHYTQGHCERVADVACALAAKAGLDTQSLFWFRIGALLHDVGKLVIPSEVLNKPTQLNAEEWDLVRQHPIAGVEMLAGVDFPWDVRPIVESHHERWDGAGYPHGLKGEEIPLTARILCIADVYDALTSQRSYRQPLAHAEAIDVMRADVGRQFDPALFALFEGVIGELVAGVAEAFVPSPARAQTASPASVQRDELTGLPLRRAFVERARRALDDRGDRPVSLIVADVDHFKLINDTYGHLDGDEALREVAQTFQRQLRDSGFVARYAGDEFVVLLDGIDAAEARERAEHLRAAVDSLTLVGRGRGWASGTIHVTLSIGVATAPAHGERVDTLFAAADAALYEAKRRGRNAVVAAEECGDLHRKPTLRLDRFSGRYGERAKLVELFNASIRGEPQVAAVVGEAGVGKTALVRELAAEVRLRAGSLVVGRCCDAEVRAPYAPWAALLNAIRVLRVVPARSWRELPHLVPSLGPAPGAQGQGSRFALFEEVTEYLRLAAAARPLVLVLDDMQWADGPTWELLEHVTDRLERDRILVCVTIRDEDTTGELSGRRARLSRDERFHELRLARLSRDELRLWLESILQQEIGAELLAFLYRHTEGNPFFTVQVLRAMVEERSLWRDGARWEWRPVSELRLPLAVKDVISRRLARLSPRARRTLAAAAVIDRVIDVDLCVEAQIATEDDLLDAIDEGLAASVLELLRARGDDRVSFTHGLLVDVLRRSLNPRRLKRIHERAARAMESRQGGAVAEIAAHFDAAGIADKAYTYALAAAERAAAVYAHEEAAGILQIALRHAATPAELAAVRCRLATVAEAAGRYQEAEELCRLAVDWFARQPAAAETAPLRRMAIRLQALQGQLPQVTCDACAALLAEAEASGDESERIALTTMISQARSKLGDSESAARLARDCVQLADRLGDPRLLADALTRLGSALLQSDAVEALALYKRARELFAGADDAYGQLRCQINIGVANSRLGNTQAAEDAYAQALARGRAAHSPDLAGLAALNLGVIALKRGRYEPARARIEESLELFTRLGNESHRLAAEYNLAHLAREQGRLSDAARGYDEVTERARALGIAEVELGALAGAGLIALAQGRHDAARVRRSEVDEAVRGKDDWWFQGRELVEALGIEVMIANGESVGARQRLRRALPLAEAHDIFGAMWLAAECAPMLLAARAGSAGEAEIRSILTRYAPRVEALGFVPLATRFGALSWPPVSTRRRSAEHMRAVRMEEVQR